MIAYLDASVVLRIILEEPYQLPEWPDLHVGVASTLLSVECNRTLDRYWLQGRLDETSMAEKRAEANTIIGRLQPIRLSNSILRKASQPLPTILGTLDAIHLASAILYRAAQPPEERPLLFATHDRAFAAAAKAMQFEVLGVAA